MTASFLAFFLLFAALPAFAGVTLSGTVTDRTTGRPSAGDTVALIAFDQSSGPGMQVATQTKTDAQGRYSIEAPDAGMHLIRVDHQKAAYFQPGPAGAHTVDIDVYDVAPAVQGLTTEADVISMQTAPNGDLQVSEDFFVKNDSKPARTQLSDHAYEFYLPPNAKLQGSAAMGPGGMPVESTPVPLAGPGHFAFVFPVRPGESRFQVSYTLPYASKTAAWAQRESLATDNLVVLLPKAMDFKPEGTDWQPVPANPDAQTFVRKAVPPGQPVAFTVSGEGQLPREAQANGGNNAGVATSGSMAADTRPGGGLGPPVDTPDPLNKYKAWLLGGLGVLLAGGAVWLLRGNPGRDSLGPEQPSANAALPAVRALRPALEAALLALEREHALGMLPAPEYQESREGLQRALHKALAREALGAQASGPHSASHGV